LTFHTLYRIFHTFRETNLISHHNNVMEISARPIWKVYFEFIQVVYYDTASPWQRLVLHPLAVTWRAAEPRGSQDQKKSVSICVNTYLCHPYYQLLAALLTLYTRHTDILTDLCAYMSVHATHISYTRVYVRIFSCSDLLCIRLSIYLDVPA